MAKGHKSAGGAPSPAPAAPAPAGEKKKRGRAPGSTNKQQPHTPLAAAGGAAASAAAAETPGGNSAPKVRRVAKNTAEAVLQMSCVALAQVFQPKALQQGLEGVQAQPGVAAAAAVINTFVAAPRAALKKLKRRRGGAGEKSFRANSIVTSMAYSQAMAAGLVDTRAVPKGLAMLAVGKAWSMWVGEAKPERVKPYVDAAEALCAALKERQARGEVFAAAVPYAEEMAKLMAAQGRLVPDYTKHIHSRLPAAIQQVAEGDRAKQAAKAAGNTAAAATPAPAAAPMPAQRKHKKQHKKQHKKSSSG